jgi:hypothetical protein
MPSLSRWKTTAPQNQDRPDTHQDRGESEQPARLLRRPGPEATKGTRRKQVLRWLSWYASRPFEDRPPSSEESRHTCHSHRFHPRR